MTRSVRKWLRVALIPGIGAWLYVTALAQTSPQSSGGIGSASAPPVPPIKSPVDFFRELLSMGSAERVQALANRSPENQKLILSKIHEYESLRPNQREVRLRLTELHFYLLPLMKLSPAERLPLLNNIPEDDRKLVDDRLKEWDRLPEVTQKELLENYSTIRYLESGASPPKPDDPDSLSSAQHEKLDAGIRQWQSLSSNQQRTILYRFRKFFDLTTTEKEKALRSLSESERQQIERTLGDFAKLPPAQRALCLQSFEKFAGLSLAERQQFLKNAERWKTMSPDERQAWKNLIERIPPAPPGFDTPPIPPASARRPLPKSASVVATNVGSQ